jgi:AcrR family transcriptional regulator
MIPSRTPETAAQPDSAATNPVPPAAASRAESFRQVAVGFQQRVQREPGLASAESQLPLSRRAREREVRRREILEVARRLFAAKGYQGTTLDEVALLTEFAKPTLYQYFDGKEHLFYTILCEGYGDLESIVRKALSGGGSTAQQFRTICVMFLIYFRKHMDFFLIHRQFAERLKRDSNQPWHEEVRRRHGEILAGLQSLFESGFGSGEFRRFDAPKLCAMFLEAVAVYTTAFREERELRSAHEMADELISLFLNGISIA